MFCFDILSVYTEFGRQNSQNQTPHVFGYCPVLNTLIVLSVVLLMQHYSEFQGQCECKDNYMGKNCDMCKPLHYDLDRGCVDCNCFTQGTLDGVAECYADVSLPYQLMFFF